MNFGCVLLDVCKIEIGRGTQIGPGVQIYTADHPREADERRDEAVIVPPDGGLRAILH